MKANLIVIQNDADHREAKALIERLIVSSNPEDRARMVAQARLVEAYERSRWPRRLRERFHISADLLISPARGRRNLAA